MAANDPARDPREEVRAEIREFLSTRRARITPEQAGLPDLRPRPAPGRRPAPRGSRPAGGCLTEYYVRLERGDATGVSESVINGVAHALQLDDAERAHLLHLLRTAGPPRLRRRARPRLPRGFVRPSSACSTRCTAHQRWCSTDVSRSLPPTLSDERSSPPCMPTRGTPSNARFVFLDPRATTFFRDWETVANDTVAILRAEAGRDPHDRDLSDLVGQLSTRSNDFRLRWAAHDVRIHSTGVKRSTTPWSATSTCLTSRSLWHPDRARTWSLHPRTHSAAQEALALLASWAASEADADRSAQGSKPPRTQRASPDRLSMPTEGMDRSPSATIQPRLGVLPAGLSLECHPSCPVHANQVRLPSGADMCFSGRLTA